MSFKIIFLHQINHLQVGGVSMKRNHIAVYRYLFIFLNETKDQRVEGQAEILCTLINKRIHFK